MSAPLVSVVMPAYRAARTVAAALRSLAAQTHAEFEVLLLDDGSDDRTAETASACGDARVRVIVDGRNLGLAARLNQGIELARGAYIARMDADDLCFPERLAAQVAALEARPDLDLVGGRALVFRGAGELLGALPWVGEHEQLCGRPWRWIPLPHPTWCGRAAWFRANRYDVRWRKAQDQELLLRALPTSRYGSVPDAVLAYRQEALGLRRLAQTRWWHARALARVFAARRDPRYLVAALAQPLKGAADLLAVASGLGYRVLAHRALPASDDDRARFARLWAAVSGAA